VTVRDLISFHKEASYQQSLARHDVSYPLARQAYYDAGVVAELDDEAMGPFGGGLAPVIVAQGVVLVVVLIS
jgi:hypothetical protein